MKKVIITLSSVILLVVILVFLLYPKNELINDNSVIKDVNEEMVIEEIKEEKEYESITENIIDNSSNVKNNSSSISNSNKDDMESNNASNSNVITKPKEPEKEVPKTNSVEVLEEPKQEQVLVEEPIVVEEVQDDIIDTNSWFYSIHHGQIDTSTQDKCLAAGNEIAFIDTVDINYFRCYEVTSTTGKILGYYLNIFCNSDNCNRYKSQIDMSKYK